ncbi:MAG: DNA-directed RNA polymerase sigma-70 factor [Cyclobacteriaceae bacterium]|nr:MAG: DNA-directed RNA polymerase sigma-70 factor [Cyclobacteriaceae bacterium]
MKISEAQLIDGCCKGDRTLQRELYQRYSASMLMVCMRYCKSRSDAEDILQDAFIKVFKNIKNFKKQSTLGYWIKKIVVNTALNFQRGKLYLFPMLELDDATNTTLADQAISNCSLEELLGMIQTLPVGCQVIFNLYAIEGYNHREIAEMLEISDGTSKSQYARARTILRQLVSKANNINYEKYQ